MADVRPELIPLRLRNAVRDTLTGRGDCSGLYTLSDVKELLDEYSFEAAADNVDDVVDALHRRIDLRSADVVARYIAMVGTILDELAREGSDDAASGSDVARLKADFRRRCYERLRDALERYSPPMVQRPSPADPEKLVFIVHGRNHKHRDDLDLRLNRFGLKTIVLDQMPVQGDTIIEALERNVLDNKRLRFACVLLSPDDEGHVARKPGEKKPRARQNVILEMGMVLACLGRARVAILHKEGVELPSDISGLVYISFRTEVKEAAPKLLQALHQAGFNPDPRGLL